MIEIGSGRMSAVINPLGAELTHLRDAEGRELMTDADPRWWTGRAPLLFPIVGRLNGDTYRLDGASYTLPQHGFARKRGFETVEASGAIARFRLVDDAETRAAYPFAFALDTLFAVAAETLTMTATVTNRSERDMPFSFGFHPAFAWPLPFGAPAEAHRIRFEKPEPAAIRQVDPDAPGLIAAARAPSPVTGDTLAPSAAMFENDALVWDELMSRSLIWGAPSQPCLRIAFPDTPWLGLWQKPGAHYLCIEPWAGMADPAGFTGDIWDKPGIIRLEPGGSRSFRLDVSLIDAV